MVTRWVVVACAYAAAQRSSPFRGSMAAHVATFTGWYMVSNIVLTRLVCIFPHGVLIYRLSYAHRPVRPVQQFNGL